MNVTRVLQALVINVIGVVEVELEKLYALVSCSGAVLAHTRAMTWRRLGGTPRHEADVVFGPVCSTVSIAVS